MIAGPYRLAAPLGSLVAWYFDFGAVIECEPPGELMGNAIAALHT